MADRDPHLIGARIAKRRHQLGWSQVELAARLGVSPSSVANWERGVSYPKKKLGKVEQVLGISLDDPAPAPEIDADMLEWIARKVPPEKQAALMTAVRAALSGYGETGEDAAGERSEPGRQAGLCAHAGLSRRSRGTAFPCPCAPG